MAAQPLPLPGLRAGRTPTAHLSRYAGVGSHRYPVGFSGDSIITWASLDFQPYFTATASNVGYGWWSHDVGGHFHGEKDDELVARWVQLGVYSPILRLHSSLSPFLTKEPWRFGERTRRVMGEQLRLRHQLLPYLQTMNRRAHEDAEPIVQPMYYGHPDEADAYDVPNQFTFGDQLLVAPITSPGERDTGLGSARAWLPAGDWVDVHTGLVYAGDRRVVLHRDLDSIPVLARAGAIVPMVPVADVAFGVATPTTLEVRVYAGADGSFVLSEDADDGRWAETRLAYDVATATVSIAVVTGHPASVPPTRAYDVVLCGFADVRGATVDGTDLDVQPGPVRGSVRVQLPAVAADTGATVRLTGDTGLSTNPDALERVFALLDAAQIGFDAKAAAWKAVQGNGTDRGVTGLLALGLPTAVSDAVIELLLAGPRPRPAAAAG